VLILLPPSEGKAAPRRGKQLDLSTLSFPGLGPTRERMLAAVVELCSGAHDPALPVQNEVLDDLAAQTLGIGPTRRGLLDLNSRLPRSPTARADRVYTGVLYDALDATTLSPAAKRRAGTRLAVTSALFGLVRPGDRIPAYRLSGDTTLPGLGPVAAAWRPVLGPAVGDALGDGLLVDLRSTTYAAFWRPPASLGSRVATVRVLHETGGKLQVVSHFNKATKGLVVRAVLEDGATPRTPADLADLLRDLGWKVEEAEPGRGGTRLDVIVDEV